ncbi:MAG: hypothetical protein L6Q60_02430 [Rhodocyclaceae bacterium]|nr:hypothetical protein [Rhodocyclaceae bacterium]
MSRGILGLLLLLCASPAPASDALFLSDSKRVGNAKMDIVVAEIERRPRVSILDVRIQAIGSSVGSSFFLLCSIRDLARQRGNFRYISKIEGNRRMLIGFLQHAGEPAANLGQEFAAAGVVATEIDLEQFAPICDRMQ